jgi:hypothetical protein
MRARSALATVRAFGQSDASRAALKNGLNDPRDARAGLRPQPRRLHDGWQSGDTRDCRQPERTPELVGFSPALDPTRFRRYSLQPTGGICNRRLPPSRSRPLLADKAMFTTTAPPLDTLSALSSGIRRRHGRASSYRQSRGPFRTIKRARTLPANPAGRSRRIREKSLRKWENGSR